MTLHIMYIKHERIKRASFEIFKWEEEWAHRFSDGIAAFTVKFLVRVLPKTAVIRIATNPKKNNLSHCLTIGTMSSLNGNKRVNMGPKN